MVTRVGKALRNTRTHVARKLPDVSRHEKTRARNCSVTVLHLVLTGRNELHATLLDLRATGTFEGLRAWRGLPNRQQALSVHVPTGGSSPRPRSAARLDRSRAV